MFGSKKEADTHDKMLELAENFSLFLGKQIDGISEQDAENIGLLLSQNKDVLIAACKGNPDLLLNIGSEAEQEASNITPLTAKA
ncbi:MAG: dsDNA-binding SOS-regulon protein [Halioglobus sp.]|jgi:dsDNA-binding SOS-regulon protein